VALDVRPGVLVTGAGGQIGSSTVCRLIQAGRRVIAVCRRDATARALKALGCDVVQGDLLRSDAWLATAPPLEAVLHLAGAARISGDHRKPSTVDDAVFVVSAARWLEESAARLGRPIPFVYSGGAFLYGDTGDEVVREGRRLSDGPLGRFVCAQRRFLLAQSHLSPRIVHPGLVWSPAGGVLEPMLTAAREGKAPFVIGDARVRWSMVHIEDLADLYGRALATDAPARDFHAVSDSGVSAFSVVARLARRHGAPKPIVIRRGAALAAIGDIAARLDLDQVIDSYQTQAMLGWRPLRRVQSEL